MTTAPNCGSSARPFACLTTPLSTTTSGSILLPFTAVYAVTEDDKVLLLRQYKHGVGKTCLTLPGGPGRPRGRPGVLRKKGAARRDWLPVVAAGLPALRSFFTETREFLEHHVFVARHVIKLADAHSGDLEEAEVVTSDRSELRRAMLSGQVPITSHVATVGIAEALFATNKGIIERSG